MIFRTRFAPSPTGPLHLGHAYSAMVAYELAALHNGEFLLRIEDIDQGRARPKWEAQIFDDLKWLGLCWPEPVLRQSTRQEGYASALDALWQRDLLYPCVCTRRDIQAAASAPQEGAPLHGPDGLIYPGTCRARKGTSSDPTPRPHGQNLRLDMSDAAAVIYNRSEFWEGGTGPKGESGQITFAAEDLLRDVGDIVLARKDMATSYHLSVVLDDAAQGITDVVRGQDLFDATQIHVLLQRLLYLPTPRYHHHALIRDETGKRLAKRDDSRAISLYRSEGATPADIRRLVGLERLDWLG
ncbi:MAG: tRNA glutamyl-Q(34) synthetase GluQRS [Pseudomonadota bacterium]